MVMALLATLVAGVPGVDAATPERPEPGTQNEVVATVLVAMANDIEINQAIVEGLAKGSSRGIRHTARDARVAYRSWGVNTSEMSSMSIDEHSGYVALYTVAWADSSVSEAEIRELLQLIRRLTIQDLSLIHI